MKIISRFRIATTSHLTNQVLTETSVDVGASSCCGAACCCTSSCCW